MDVPGLRQRMIRWHYVVIAFGLLWCSMLTAVSAASLAPGASPYGPLRVVNQHPVQILFLQPFPDVAETTQAERLFVHLDTSLTNTLVDQNRDFTANLDLEMVRTVLDLRYGVLPRLEVGLELPLLYTYGGILDDFIYGAEHVLVRGQERMLRDDQRVGEFTYRVLRGNRVLIRGRDEALGFGDLVLKAKAQLLREQDWWPMVSVRAAVKFPTGATDKAFGSGRYDSSLGVLLQKTFGRWTLYVNGDVTFPGQAFEDEGLSLRPFVGAIAAAEFRLSNPISLVAQFRGDTRPFHDSIPILDKRIIETLLGVNWAVSRRLTLQIGFVEDQFASACCSADVSFFLNLAGRL